MTPAGRKPVNFDLAGIGAGPFNLSLAAAMTHAPMLCARFFEASAQMDWHGGLMLPGAVLQTSPLKDLITPIRPTSPYTFLNYLVEEGRFHDFMSGRFRAVERLEFAAYLRWCAARLASVKFGQRIDRVEAGPGGFRLIAEERHIASARALSVGIGTEACIPSCAAPHIGPDCFHASEFKHRAPKIEGRRVAVIGGGQTGAEIFLHLLSAENGPAESLWVDRRPRISPLEEGAFIDQLFTPAYGRRYRDLPPHLREKASREQRLASDGLTAETIESIYRLLYRRVHLEGRGSEQAVASGAALVAMRRERSGFAITIRDMALGREVARQADLVILATGWQKGFPRPLAPLRDQLALDENGDLILDEKYRAAWHSSAPGPLFALNRGCQSHGVAEAQLSLMAWRSGVIVNSLSGKPVFALREAEASLMGWGAPEMDVALSEEPKRAEPALSE